MEGTPLGASLISAQHRRHSHFHCKKHAKVACNTEGCVRATNKNCGNYMCNKCYLRIEMQVEDKTKTACILKDHRPPKLHVAEEVANEQKEQKKQGKN